MVRGKLFLVGIIGIASALFIAAGFSSCCQPSHKDSNPVIVDSLFQETYGRDIDLQQLQSGSTFADSAYYPIYTFGIANTGTADDDFTLQIRYTCYRISGDPQVGGFDITRHVPAGDTVLFKTPIAVPDSITQNEFFFYPVFPNDTLPNMDFAYFFLSFQTTDSAKINFMQPSVDILSGAINNGPEACNTPASQMNINVNTLPIR